MLFLCKYSTSLCETRWSILPCLSHENNPRSLKRRVALPYTERYTAYHGRATRSARSSVLPPHSRSLCPLTLVTVAHLAETAPELQKRRQSMTRLIALS